MRGMCRYVCFLRFRTLLFLILALNVAVFIILNSVTLHDKDKLDGDSPESNIQVLKSKKFNFAYRLSEKGKENHGWKDLKEFSNQDELQPLLDTPLEESTFINNHVNSDNLGLRIPEEEDKTITSSNTKKSTSQNDQNLVLKISTTSSFHQQDGGDERLTTRSSNNFPLTKSAVLPANSRILVTETFSNKHRMSIPDIQNLQPSKESYNTNSLMEKIDSKEILVTQRTLLKTSSKAAGPEHAIPQDKKISSRGNKESSIVNKGMAQVDKILPSTTKPLTQEVINSIAENMEVRFEVLEDIRTAEITLRNKGSAPIERDQWSVHFCITTGMELGHLVHRPEGYVLPGEKSIKLTHFNGCAYKLEPTRDFKAILPGNSLKFMVHIGPTLARSDLATRWYVTASGLEPRIISNTADESLDFVFLSKRKKPWDRFKNNDVADLGKAPLLVIPTPLEIVGLNESRNLSIDSDWVVFGEPGLEEESSFLAGKLQLQKSLSQTTDRKAIKLTIGKVQLVMPEEKQQLLSNESSSETYQLQVDASEQLITITGAGNAGVFYGVQTLLSLVDYQGSVPQVSIKDSPRFAYRGLMVDVVRNFQPKHEILKLLDVMAMYKMNKFHFHLSDNEGWRLEIPGIEELTSVGSRRCHDIEEKRCVMSQLGSGPYTNTSGTGYYSTEDYREILRHATARHIQVIPEFDFPGHSHAAIKSMIARHDRLMQQGNEKDAKQFLLNDFKDESRYLSIQMFTDETSNCCLNSTYNLMEFILKTLVSLHSDIQPLTVYHFGGDEIPGGAWQKSPACEQLARTLNFPYNNINTHNKLKKYFLQRLTNITAKMNLAIGGWGDFLFEPKTRSLFSREFFPNKEVYSFAWSITGAAKNNHEVSLMANNGYKVVLSSPDFIYLDHPYEPDPEERGKYWATRYTDTRKIFGFMPEDLYEDIDKIRNCSGLKKCVDGRQNVLGVEAAVWGETIRTADHMHSMIFPRLLALAELAWHKAPWEDIRDRGTRDREKTGDWMKFANTLGYKELARLGNMGVAYHVTPPGARFVGKKLETRAALPGLKVEYSTDGGVTWNDVTPDTKVDGKIKLKTRSADGQRVSREVEIEPPTPAPVANKNDNIVFQPQPERKQEQPKEEADTKKKNGEKPQAAEHIKTDEHLKGKKENSWVKDVSSELNDERSEIKIENSEIKEEKTDIKEESSKIQDEKSDHKDLKENVREDHETKTGVNKDEAEKQT